MYTWPICTLNLIPFFRKLNIHCVLLNAFLILYTLLAIISGFCRFPFKGCWGFLSQTALLGLCSGLYVSGSKDLILIRSKPKFSLERHMCTFLWAAGGVKIHFYKIQGNLHLTWHYIRFRRQHVFCENQELQVVRKDLS